jgi:uncharacterized membrane protein YraQ (UPF0718 family)
VIFAAAFFLPVECARFNTAIAATFDLLKWYAREHVVLCLLPAFFIAGVISVFVRQGSVIKYFGANAKKWILILCCSLRNYSGSLSCTILPYFQAFKEGSRIRSGNCISLSGRQLIS